MGDNRSGLVASARREANDIGEAVFAQGGNAVDAAVAASFAIGVAEPYMGGIGGVGEIVVAEPDGTVHVVDCAARAPIAARPDLYEIVGEATGLYAWPAVAGDRNIFGQLAVTAPQLVQGLKTVHERLGRLPWADVVQPAADLARRGVAADHFTAAVVAHEMETFAKDGLARALYYPGGRPIKPPIDGNPEILPNAPLADTLEILVREKLRPLAPDGAIARAILATLPDGILAPDDFAFDAATRFLSHVAPLAEFRGWRIHGSPLPSGSMTVAQILDRLARQAPFEDAGAAERYALVAEASLAAFDTRLERSPSQRSGGPAASRTPTATTHVSAVGSDGTAVSITQSLLSLFGAQVGVGDCGFFLNNGMMWFDPRPGRSASIASGKRAMMAVSPVIAVHEATGRRISVGALGARRIITAVAQTLDNAISYDDTIDAAVNRPRIHADGIGRPLVDHRLPLRTVEALSRSLGPVETAYFGPTSLNFARASAVGFDPRNGELEKGIDLRARSVWALGEEPS